MPQTYTTTDKLTGPQTDDFIAWFDQEIGTETEVNPNGGDEGWGLFSITFFELTANEVSKCRYHEKKILKEAAQEKAKEEFIASKAPVMADMLQRIVNKDLISGTEIDDEVSSLLKDINEGPELTCAGCGDVCGRAHGDPKGQHGHCCSSSCARDFYD